MEPDMLEALCGPQDDLCYHAGWKKDSVDAFMITDVGRKRQNNEDSCVICAPNDEGLQLSRGFFLGVADGMGGASAGEYASCKCLEYACRTYFDKSRHALVPAMLRMAVESANEFIFQESEAKQEYAGMGTTFSGVAILGNWCYVAQVGDSRVYLLRQNKGLRQITQDHSLVAEQVRSGLINKDEAHNHSLKNLITRAVGIKEQVEVDLFAFELELRDTLLICSDGLSNMVSDELLMKHLAGENLEDMGRLLVQEALDAGGTDNITLIAIRITAPPPVSHYQQGAKLISLNKSGLLSRLMHAIPGYGR